MQVDYKARIALIADMYTEALTEMNTYIARFNTNPMACYNSQDWKTNMGVAMIKVRTASDLLRKTSNVPQPLMTKLLKMARAYDRYCVQITRGIDNRYPAYIQKAQKTVIEANKLAKEVANMLIGDTPDVP